MSNLDKVLPPFSPSAVSVGEFRKTNAGSNTAAECERSVSRDAGQKALQTLGGGEGSLFFEPLTPGGTA